MAKVVRAIVDQLTEGSINDVLAYVSRLEQIHNTTFEVAILNTTYSVDYRAEKARYAQFKQQHPDLTIENFYVEQYQTDDAKNTLGTYLQQYFDGEKVIQVIDADGQITYQVNQEVRAIKTDRRRNYTLDLFKAGETVMDQRLFVNHDHNVQVVRYHDQARNTPLHELYVDTQLQPFLDIAFDLRKKQSGFKQVGPGRDVTVDSRLELYELWLKRQIQSDDLVLNLHPECSILFENWASLDNIYDMA